VRFANAGHPPALRMSAAGDVSWIPGALAPPLGTVWAERLEAELMLDPGDRVVLYTDGLVERREATLDDGLAGLAAAATEAGDLDLAALCDRVIDKMTGADGFEDDVAMLAFERLR
jgi:serine phosphatase RsbU (regulator of sigma subunit)